MEDLKERKTLDIENKGPKKDPMTECDVTATKGSKYYDTIRGTVVMGSLYDLNADKETQRAVPLSIGHFSDTKIVLNIQRI
ncbi:hypothetical protein CHS0354_037843 [Potamilus streckersoni]|uniref:Uncharacterized protein n=1 Tax=Potamilus streckersoni TaxID=2493646 RepID=A0AAE0VXH8_9BIVA|nr:hypothetical protein CHS0354_037843 [Potamilus streckersoni]